MRRSRIPGVSKEDVKGLELADVKSAEDLWQSATADLAKLAGASGLPRARLIELLGSLAARDAARVAHPRTRHFQGFLRHVLLVTVFAVAVALGATLILQAASRALSASVETDLVTTGPNGVVAYVALSASDLVRTRRSRTDGSFAKLEDVVGRYPLRPLAPGTVVRKTDLSGRKIDATRLRGKTIVTLQLSTAPLAPPDLPFVGSLHASPRPTSSRAELSIDDVLVMGIRSEAGRTTVDVAIDPSFARSLNAVLGSSDLFLAYLPSSGRPGDRNEPSKGITSTPPDAHQPPAGR